MQNALYKRPCCSTSVFLLHFLPSSLVITAPKALSDPLSITRKRRRNRILSGRIGLSSDCRIRAMPCSSIETNTSICGGGGGGGGDNDSLLNFKLNQSTFLASLMPKREIGADRFIEAHPHYDGRSALIAIFGSVKPYWFLFILCFCLELFVRLLLNFNGGNLVLWFIAY